MYTLTKAEMHILKEALEGTQAEFEQLTRDKDWFISDVLDLHASALEIVHSKLGISPQQEEEYEIE